MDALVNDIAAAAWAPGPGNPGKHEKWNKAKNSNAAAIRVLRACARVRACRSVRKYTSSLSRRVEVASVR
eukprot:scaffold46705_cov36-Phaeocystis_antarctica.AAC.6